ncbi:MAG: heme biosynthesis protein [Proteobacteria bacterium]|nr:MAG: heme biosynthesis protein [Pseudomonadota bacterium]
MSAQLSSVKKTGSLRQSYAVWEITLKCNLACSHCGSRAGDARHNELSTAEAFDLVHQMAEVGITEVSLIGGEAFLRADWLDIAREVVQCGMICSMTTGGYGISQTTAERMKETGINQVSVSLDGMQATHDKLRGRADSWHYALQTMRHLHNAGVYFGANSQVNRLSAPEFALMYQTLLEAGAKAWQVQLTVPMGNAVENAAILMQPSELLHFYPLLALLAQRGHREGLIVQPGNNIGYYGPYERLLRSMGRQAQEWMFWRGCSAGLATIGIEADGTIKACPSLPTAVYSGGNIRQNTLIHILTERDALTFNLTAGTPQATDHLWGFCKTCDYAELCRAGCSWTAHVFFDKRGNNPYCHHRALVNAANGQREYLSLKRAADGVPFDNGEFAMAYLPLEADWGDDPLHFTLDKVQWPESWQADTAALQERLQAEVRHAIRNTQQAIQQRSANLSSLPA